jgi:hypothetical protein
LDKSFEGFRELLDRRASAHPFENVQSLLPVTSWLGAFPVPGNFVSDYIIYSKASSFGAMACFLVFLMLWCKYDSTMLYITIA